MNLKKSPIQCIYLNQWNHNLGNMKYKFWGGGGGGLLVLLIHKCEVDYKTKRVEVIGHRLRFLWFSDKCCTFWLRGLQGFEKFK